MMQSADYIGRVYAHRHFAANTLAVTDAALNPNGVLILKGLWEGCFDVHFELLTLLELNKNWKLTAVRLTARQVEQRRAFDEIEWNLMKGRK